MLKKTITYEDYNGEMRTEDFYFSLNQAEVLKLELKTPGGFKGYVEKIIQTKDFKSMVELLDDLISMSYGIKSDDGRKFEKSPEISKAFMESEAYVQLVLELLSGDEEKISAFIEGILPQKLVAEAKAAKALNELENKDLATVDKTANTNAKN